MYRYNYNNNKFDWRKILKLVIIGVTIIAALGIFLYFFLDINKFNYNRYKKYEVDINKKLDVINGTLDKHLKEYTSNTITKTMMIKYYEDSSLQCNRLYSSFTWRMGDEGTKELYIIKKHIILIYAYIYISKANALKDKMEFQESVEVDFITKLQDRYVMKDRIERIKFNIPLVVQ